MPRLTFGQRKLNSILIATFAEMLLGLLLSMTDSAIVGHLIGLEALSAINTIMPLNSLSLFLGTVVSSGASLAYVREIGLFHREKAYGIFGLSLLIASVFGFLLFLLGIFGLPVYIRAIGVGQAVAALSREYMVFFSLCLLLMPLKNLLSSMVFCDGGEVIGAASSISNSIGNALFSLLLGWKFGIRGVALASTVSQGVAAWLTVRYLQKAEGDFHLDLRRIRIDGGILWEVVRIGAPAGLQNLVITLSNVFVQYKINGFGVDSVAAFASYFKVELLNYLPIVAFGQAMMTFSGQNIGAGKADRVKKGVRVCILMGAAYVVCSAGLLLLFGKQAFWVFNRDPGVIACGLRIIRVTFPFYWLYVILEVLADATRGAGKSLPPMLIILFNICVLRTVLLFAFTARWHVLEAVAATYPLAWFGAAVCLLIYWRGGRWLSNSTDEVQHETV